MTGIEKRFGGVRAIRHADITVMPGEIHALVGENGAGKSTLIKVLAGAEFADAGAIEIDGESVTIRTAADAMELGVATVYQDAQLFGQLTVAENVFLGREMKRGNWIDWAAQNAVVVDLLELLELPASYSTRHVEELSAAEQQQVSIGKALSREAKILILDEPSAILTDAEIEVLFNAIRKLTTQGVSIIYISHRLDELFRIADAVTVMRDGQTIGTFDMKDMTVPTMVDMMVGGLVDESDYGKERVRSDEVLLELRDLASGHRFEDINLTVKAGEIVVLYGLVGSGVAEIASAVYGMKPITNGSVVVRGSSENPKNPRHAKRLGIGMLPANRKKEGMFSFQPIRFNISIGNLPRLTKALVWLDRGGAKENAKRMIDRLAIKTPNDDNPISSLSGGNAQKVIISRQVIEEPRVLILAEPSQGVDVGAKEEIHKLVDMLASSGSAVLVATSDLGEALRIADRLLVIRGGRIFAEFGRNASQAQVLAAAAGSIDDQKVGA